MTVLTVTFFNQLFSTYRIVGAVQFDSFLIFIKIYKYKMLRFCVQNLCVQNKLLYQPIIVKEITKNVKCVSGCPHSIKRHFASKTKEDEKLERIYYGPLTPQIRAVKIFSLSSSMAGLLAQPIIIKEAATIGSTSLLIALCSVVGFFTFVTPLLLHIVTKKYVTEIHYDPETSTYKATTITFFLRPKQVNK